MRQDMFAPVLLGRHDSEASLYRSDTFIIHKNAVP